MNLFWLGGFQLALATCVLVWFLVPPPRDRVLHALHWTVTSFPLWWSAPIAVLAPLDLIASLAGAVLPHPDHPVLQALGSIEIGWLWFTYPKAIVPWIVAIGAVICRLALTVDRVRTAHSTPRSTVSMAIQQGPAR
ncbi:hypothetical protein [Eleftheria terrae]|uniref:hypothetical protein n=1 Tax=Eleftheria terrae TaxID=1597781 RepID=UPI00263B2B2E|nr:hypothetical protein [Eleftheria terrae]WKB50570.1 hypothetical protein N7L95_00180 [Eleftheria terrae]